MNNHRLHWRISFGTDVFYHILATSDVPKNSKTERWSEPYGGYAEKNGFAFILPESSTSDSEHEPVFVQYGTALDAMNKMVEILEKMHGKKCLQPIIKL
ncbi:MAG: hypothetical protein HUJ63_13860 [Enterococcus sp.]|nr:hypothetical protein [Enterococcus sp.]